LKRAKQKKTKKNIFLLKSRSDIKRVSYLHAAKRHTFFFSFKTATEFTSMWNKLYPALFTSGEKNKNKNKK